MDVAVPLRVNHMFCRLDHR